MSSPLVHPGQPKTQVVDWARLIPGENPFRSGGKKPNQSVRSCTQQKVSEIAREAAAKQPESALTLLMPGPLQSRMAERWVRCMAADFALVSLNWLLIGALLVPLRILFPQVRLSIGLLFCGAGLLHFAALWTWRWQSAWQTRRTPRRADVRNVLIVGAGGVGRRVAAYLEMHPEAGRAICGFLDNERPLGNGVIGRVTDLARMARTGFVDEVILAAPHDRSLTVHVVREAQRLRLDVEIVPELFGCKPSGTEFDRVGDLPVICLHAERLPAAGLVLKRVVDVMGAGLAVAVLSPLLAGIAGLIKLDSSGPVFYCAQRAGRKGRHYARGAIFATLQSG